MTLQAAQSHAEASDAVTLQFARSYSDAVSAQTLNSANIYTDSQVGALRDDFTAFQGVMNGRVNQLSKELQQVGAVSAAMAQMTASAAAVKGTHAMAFGVGTYRGQQAMSLGYQGRLSERMAVTLGASFSGDHNAAGAGFAFGW